MLLYRTNHLAFSWSQKLAVGNGRHRHLRFSQKLMGTQPNTTISFFISVLFFVSRLTCKNFCSYLMQSSCSQLVSFEIYGDFSVLYLILFERNVDIRSPELAGRSILRRFGRHRALFLLIIGVNFMVDANSQNIMSVARTWHLSWLMWMTLHFLQALSIQIAFLLKLRITMCSSKSSAVCSCETN